MSLLSPIQALRVIQLILAAVLVVMGVYIAGPWYVPIDSTAFGIVAAQSTISVKTVGASYAVSGLVLAVGTIFKKCKVRRVGLWLTIYSFTMMMITRITVQGLIPFIWVLQLGLLMVAVTLSLAERGE